MERMRKIHRNESDGSFMFHGNKRKVMLMVLGFLLLILTSVLSDGFFLWLRLSEGFLTVIWGRKPIFSALIPYLQGPRIPLWIPLASLSIILSYIVMVGRRLNLQISLRRRRLHHYQIGILSISLSILLIVPLFLPGFQDTPLQIISKGTSLSEILEGLSFIFFIGGVLLTLMDARDLLSGMKAWLKSRKRSTSTQYIKRVNEQLVEQFD